MKCKLPSLLKIYQKCALSVSGIKRIAIANYSGDYSFASSDGCEIDSIDLNDEHFYEINFAEGSGYGSANVTIGNNAEQKSVVHQIGFTLPNIDCNLIENWARYLLARVIFAVETKNGQVLLFGIDNGMSATQFDYSTGVSDTDANGITALFEASQTNAPLIVQDWSLIEALYPQDEPDYSKQYLTFEALQSGTFSCSKTVDYSIDGGQNWTTLDANTASPTVNTGNKIIWKNTQSGNKVFYATGNFNASGNVMSMVYGDNFQNQTTFPGGFTLSVLFKNNTKLISAGNLILPVTEFDTTRQMAYYEMFRGCTALTTAPSILPATTLNTNCYNSMFKDCTALTTAPALPSAILALQCYAHMFSGCTALTTAPVLPATTLASGCYWNMFYGCTTLTSAPELPATRLIDSQGVLPMSCYEGMFQNCTNLNRIKAMFIDDPSPYEYSCTKDWVNGVAATGTFIKNADAQWNVTGVNGIPENWTVVEIN